jgi:hypothetical protein
MRAVLGKEQRADNGKETDEDKPGPRHQKATLQWRAVIRLIMIGHAILLVDDWFVAIPSAEAIARAKIERCARPMESPLSLPPLVSLI